MSTNLKIERHIDASPDECFALWMQPDALAQWWGPKDAAGNPFSAQVQSWSANAGDEWSIIMTAPGGTRYYQSGTMLAVERPHLLRFTFAWQESGQNGPVTEISIAFAPEGSGTRMVFEQTGFADEAARDEHMTGWQECLDRFSVAADTKGADT